MEIPRSLQVEDVLWSVTYKCNLDCIYCSVKNERGNQSQLEPDRGQIRRIIDQLSTLPRLNSIILSGGEFLLSPHRQFILDAIHPLKKNVFIITNSTYCGKETLHILQKYRPTIMVSVDSSREEINSKTRGPGKLRLAGRNIKKFLGSGLELVLILVVTKHNIHTIVEDLIYWRKVGIKNVLLQQLHAEGGGSQLFDELSPKSSDVNNLYASLAEFEKDFPNISLDYNEICLFPKRLANFQRKCEPNTRYKPQRIFMCGAGFKFLAIKVNGDLIPCNAMQDYVLGNIIQNDIQKIIKDSPVLLDIQGWKNHRVNEIEGCEDCTFNPVCDGGCRADVINLGKGLLARHPLCGILPGLPS